MKNKHSRGKICKLCDRKFLLKMVMDQNEERMFKKRNETKQKKEAQKRVEKRIESLDQMYKQTRALSTVQ